jgi:glucose/mannose transport system permease protein
VDVECRLQEGRRFGSDQVALTNGGPGIATDVPAKFIMDFLFLRANIGLASAGATVMLVAVVAAVTPWVYVVYMRPKR